jgi:uncharacterized protein (TIGR01319 family)
VLQHNSGAPGQARDSGTVPVVVAGNTDAADEVAALLTSAGARRCLADNVLPRDRGRRPGVARAAIREAFLTHVIGGKGLSRDPAFARARSAPPPPTRCCAGVEVLAEVLDQDVLVVDVGGATTDVYSVSPPRARTPAPSARSSPTLRHARTVEADLGMRWSARVSSRPAP